jgi:hypothetical protein
VLYRQDSGYSSIEQKAADALESSRSRIVLRP